MNWGGREKSKPVTTPTPPSWASTYCVAYGQKVDKTFTGQVNLRKAKGVINKSDLGEIFK